MKLIKYSQHWLPTQGTYSRFVECDRLDNDCAIY